MTTLVGRSSLPLREAFYFELPVFYSGNILDNEYANFVNELNLKDFTSLKKYLYNNDYSIDKDKVAKAKEFYNSTCNNNIIISSYKDILKDFKSKIELWEKV